MSDYSDSDDEGRVLKKKGLTAEQRAKLMKTTQLTELEMVEMWNQYKFNFPTGKANQKQLKQLMKKVCSACQPKDYNNLEEELNSKLVQQLSNCPLKSPSGHFWPFIWAFY